MSGCVIRCERPKKNCGAEKKLGAENKIGGVEKVIWPPNTITRRRQKKKKARFFRLGAEKYDFRLPKEQRPIIWMFNFQRFSIGLALLIPCSKKNLNDLNLLDI